MHSFLGRCPGCNQPVKMTKVKKVNPLDPVTEWRGRCQSDHAVSVVVTRTEEQAAAEPDDVEEEE